jgi:hypothetical protein
MATKAASKEPEQERLVNRKFVARADVGRSLVSETLGSAHGNIASVRVTDLELTKARRPEHVALGDLESAKFVGCAPVIVHEGVGGKKYVIDGWRRVLLAVKHKIEEISIVNVGLITDQRSIELCLRTSVANKSRDPRETARLIQEFKKSAPETSDRGIGRALGISHTYIGEMLAVGSLPEAVQTLIAEGKLNLSHAVELADARLSNDDVIRWAEVCIRDGLSAAGLKQAIVDEQNGQSKDSDDAQDAQGVEDVASVEAGNQLPDDAPAAKSAPHVSAALNTSPLDTTSLAAVAGWIRTRWADLQIERKDEVIAELKTLLDELVKSRDEAKGDDAQ